MFHSEADEGEGESADVPVAAPAMTVTIPTPPTLPQAPSLPSTQPIITPIQPTTAYHHNDSNRQSSSQLRQQSQASSSAVNIAANASHRDSGGGGGENRRQTTLDLFPKKPRPETTRLVPKNSTSSSTASTNNRVQPTQNNPYPSSNSSTGGRMNSHISNIALVFHQRQPPLNSSTLPNNANIVSIDDSPPHSTTHSTIVQPLQQPVPFNPYSSLRPSSQDSSVVLHDDTTNTGSNTAAACVSSTTFTSNPSFSELKTILQTLRSNRALYEQYYGKIITVPCKINYATSDENVFNIVKSSQESVYSQESGGGGDASSTKRKKDKSKKEKKYEFLLVGKFVGPKQSDGAIACRVDSSLVGTYFNDSPVSVVKLFPYIHYS